MTKISRTYKYHPDIDRYMEMVLSEEIESCQEQKDLIKFVIEKLEQPNVVIDHDVINAGFENLIFCACSSAGLFCILR